MTRLRALIAAAFLAIPFVVVVVATPAPAAFLAVSGGSTSVAVPSVPTGRSWAERSTAAGVTAAYSFSSGIGGYDDGWNGTRGFHDTTVKVETGGSLRFELRAGETGANIAGSWTIGSAPYTFADAFGEGDTFWVQYRARITQSMLDNLDDWDSVWKQIIIHNHSASCANMEITHTHPFNGSTIYLECGAKHAYTVTSGPSHTEGAPLLWQQRWTLVGTDKEAGYESQYPTINWEPDGDSWTTYQYKIAIGTLTADGSVEDSTIEMWVQEGDVDSWQKVIAVRLGLKYDSADTDVFDTLTLTPYMTGLTTSSSTLAENWFTELIITTQEPARPLPASSF